MITLSEFILQRQAEFPYAKGDLTRMLHHLSVAAKVVHQKVCKAGLVDILGRKGSMNVHGEQQEKLDVFAHEKFIQMMLASEECCGIASEESDDIIFVDNPEARDGGYILCIDPIDGSSNIDVNVSIGTIFSIYRRKSPRGFPPLREDFLQPGTSQVAAGYIIYGPATMLVYTTGAGVNGFTLDPAIGEFCLSHLNIMMPEWGGIYSINQGHFAYMPEGVKQFVRYCQSHDPETKRPYTLRYVGSLVADIHRNMLRGGIFIYPSVLGHPKGKLRLIYECNPIAFLAEQSGGKASDGFRRIMEIRPHSLHQRVPLFIGSKKVVEMAEMFMEEYCEE